MGDRTKLSPTRIECYFDGMSEIGVRNYPSTGSRRRAVVTASTEDGQTMFFDVRDVMIDKILEMNVEIDDAITVDFVFQGKEFNGRWFNNLFINDINFSE